MPDEIRITRLVPENPHCKARNVISLDEGHAEFLFPYHLSEQSAADLEETLLLMLRGIKRRASHRAASVIPIECPSCGVLLLGAEITQSPQKIEEDHHAS